MAPQICPFESRIDERTISEDDFRGGVTISSRERSDWGWPERSPVAKMNHGNRLFFDMDNPGHDCEFHSRHQRKTADERIRCPVTEAGTGCRPAPMVGQLRGSPGSTRGFPGENARLPSAFPYHRLLDPVHRKLPLPACELLRARGIRDPVFGRNGTSPWPHAVAPCREDRDPR
jgi:hypothetical protein